MTSSASNPNGMSARLSTRTLAHIGTGIATPRYDRSAIAPGIVHLGLGAFFRAHGAEYIDDILALEPGPWGIVGVSLQRPDLRNRLQPQDCLYTLIARDDQPPRARVIGSVLDTLVAPEDPSRVLSKLTDPMTRIVSLTITEKGYCHDPATGRLQVHHPDIQHDLSHLSSPRTAIGFLVAALKSRHSKGLPPLTVLCCDNLPHNGTLLRGLVRDFAALHNDSLAQWIEAEVAFPSTMVDRIVPASTPSDIADAARLLALHDDAPVAHEPFRQWVIEDTFIDRSRPALHHVGAQLVTDVAPYEDMKLKLLNGAHSALAYLGYLGGHQTIADCVADPVYRNYTSALWREEILPTMTAPPGINLPDYTAALLTRFDNPAIRHRTWQIAMDGSQKIPQRLLQTIRTRLRAQQPVPRLASAIAAWMLYVGGRDLRGDPIDVRDPLAATLSDAIAAAGSSSEGRVRSLLKNTQIFDLELASSQQFEFAVTSAYDRLRVHGARASLASIG